MRMGPINIVIKVIESNVLSLGNVSVCVLAYYSAHICLSHNSLFVCILVSKLLLILFLKINSGHNRDVWGVGLGNFFFLFFLV